MKRITLFLLIFGSLSLLSACGGGGGGGTPPPAAVTKALVKLISSGSGTIYGIDVTVSLPAGVTVPSANPPAVDSGIIVPSGAAANNTIATAVYTPATSTAAAKVRVLIVNANGFATGEFCSLNGDIAAGHSPTAADFAVESFAASDADGNVIAGITPGITADIR